MKFLALPSFLRFKPDETRHSYACVKQYQRWPGFELNVSGIFPGAVGATETEAVKMTLARVASDIPQFLWHGAALSDFELGYSIEPIDSAGYVFAPGSRPTSRRIARTI